MIFVSSSCIKAKTIKEAVEVLVREGYTCIELSGGTEPYPELLTDLLNLQHEHGLRYTIHNYFPPPDVPFIINLASEDKEIVAMTLDHFGKAIQLATALNSDVVGMHAGFYFDPDPREIGKSFSRYHLSDPAAAGKRFAENYRKLCRQAGELSLYIENNVLSEKNFRTYGVNPFMLTTYAGYLSMKDRMDFPVILDVAHLKVSCATLGLNFDEELASFLSVSDYIHISDNDGITDANHPFIPGSSLYELLALCRDQLREKRFTLEVYDGTDQLRSSFDALSELIS